MLVFILTLIVILLVVFFYIRMQNYKKFITNISKEHFTNTDNKKINLKKELPANPNIVFCDYEGNTIIIKNTKIWKLNNQGKIIVNSENINTEFNLPYSLNIKTGTIDNKNLIILTQDNMIIEYDLIEKEIISSTKISEYFFDVKDNIDCMVFYKNKYFLFTGKQIIIYDKTTETIKGTQNASEIFKQIPNNITCAFLNNNVVLENVEHGVPCFFKNKDLYIYDEIKK